MPYRSVSSMKPYTTTAFMSSAAPKVNDSSLGPSSLSHGEKINDELYSKSKTLNEMSLEGRPELIEEKDNASSFGSSSLSHGEKIIDELYSKSKTLNEMSLEGRLELIEEIIDRLSVIKKHPWARHDLNLTKLHVAPDGTGMARNVENINAFNQMVLAQLVSDATKSIRKNIKYQIAQRDNDASASTPDLLKNVRKETLAGRERTIYGPTELSPLFHKMELYASGEETQNEVTPHNDDDDTGIELALPAGNQSLFLFFDTLESVFNPPYRPVLIKHHGLRPYLEAVFADLFSPLIERGFANQVQDESIEMTSSLISNPKVKHVKMTGSYPTAVAIHNTISKSRPHLSESEVHEMFVSELGNVTPWIISPGKYSERELRNAADYIVVAKNLYGGCNCLNAQAVVLPSGWKQKDEFKKLLFERFEKTSIDPLYYPGSDRLVQKIVDHYAGTDAIRQIAGPTMDRSGDVHDSDIVNPYIVDCGTFGEDGYDNFALTNEAFGPLLALVELPSDGDSEDGKYLTEQAVPFVNNKDNMFGSLSCSLLYPSSQKDSIEIKEATGALNYGCVGHNTWTAIGFFSMSYGGIWGGSKFEPLGQSGRGTGGNFYHIKNLEKSVVYSKSLSFPLLISKDSMPPAFVSNAMSALSLSRSPKRIIQKMLKRG